MFFVAAGRSRRRSWSSPRTRRSTASRCCPRCSAATATCRASSPTAATGWCSPTASCCSPAVAARADRRLRRRGHAADPALHPRACSCRSRSARRAWSATGRALLRTAPADGAAPRRVRRKQALNAAGAPRPALVFVIVLLTKFAQGAWIVVVAAPILFVGDEGGRRPLPPGRPTSSRRRASGVAAARRTSTPSCWSRTCSRRRCARSPSPRRPPRPRCAPSRSRPTTWRTRCRREWEQRGVPVPLVVIESPYRETVRPVQLYVRQLRRDHPGDVDLDHHPRVRRGPLVAAPAAQPDRAAAQGAPAVRAVGDRDERTVGASEAER